jgi:hypothetical protein
MESFLAALVSAGEQIAAITIVAKRLILSDHMDGFSLPRDIRSSRSSIAV